MPATSVIAATDGSPQSLRAVEWAAQEAARRGEPLRIVSAPSLPPRMSPDLAHRETIAGLVHRAVQRALSDAAQRAAEVEPGLTVGTEMLSGAPEKALLDLAPDASMLVVGSRGAGGFSAMVLGSVSRYVATHATCPVVVAREETMALHRQVVVGVHDPDQAAATLGFAFEEAALRHARLLAVHCMAWSSPPLVLAGRLSAEEWAVVNPGETPAELVSELDSTLAGWRDKHPDVQAGWEVVHSHPARVLAGVSARADLVVLGRHPGAHAVNSVTYAVLSHAHGPVAVVPGE